MTQPYDTWFFTGDEETYSTLAAGDAVDGGWAGEHQLTTLPATDHGFKASAGSLQSLIYIQETTNYDGLKRIYSVATSTITIIAPYVAETFTTADTIKTMYGDNHPFELVGYEVHLSAVGGAGTLTVTLDAADGSAFDTVLGSHDMTSDADVSTMFDPPIPCKANDKIDVAYANANDKTFGIKIFTRRRV